jgi:hypothetical protein
MKGKKMKLRGKKRRLKRKKKSENIIIMLN